MKRLVNIRIALLFAIAFILGIYSFYEILFGDIWFGSVALAILVAWLIFCIATHRKMWIAVVLAIVIFAMGLGRSALTYVQANGNEVYCRQVTISGRVTDIGRNGEENNDSLYYLEQCTDSDGTVYRGRVRVNLLQENTLKTGDVVQLNGELRSAYPINQNVNSFYLRRDVRYILDDASLLGCDSGRLRADESVRKYIYETVSEYMPDNSGLMYALLTGDRNAVTEDAEWAFSRAGIVHLLAVSGLHVGFIATALCFALRRFRLHPLAEGSIVMIPLIFYAYICDFTPSVVRAIAMLLCSYLTRLFISRYDMVSSLSLSAIVNLTINPFYLFDMGFQLSYMSVFGIATVFVAFQRFLTRQNVNRYLRKVLEPVVLSLICIFATFSVLACNGMEIAFMGVALNIIVIPLVSVAFALGFFGLLPWVFHYILVASDALLQMVLFVARSTAFLNFATVRSTASPLAVLVMIILMYALGGFVNISKKGACFFYPISCVLLVLTLFWAQIEYPARTVVYVSVTENDIVVGATSRSGEGVIVADFADYSDVCETASKLDRLRLNSVELYFSHTDGVDIDAVKAVFSMLKVDKVYFFNASDNVELLYYLRSEGIEPVVQYPNAQTGNDVKVRSIFDATLTAVTVETGDINICIVYDFVEQGAVNDFGLGADAYVLYQPATLYDGQIVQFTPYQYDIKENYGTNKYGNFTIRQKSGKISVVFR